MIYFDILSSAPIANGTSCLNHGNRFCRYAKPASSNVESSFYCFSANNSNAHFKAKTGLLSFTRYSNSQRLPHSQNYTPVFEYDLQRKSWRIASVALNFSIALKFYRSLSRLVSSVLDFLVLAFGEWSHSLSKLRVLTRGFVLSSQEFTVYSTTPVVLRGTQ